jgi:competence protein ComEC
MIVGMLFYRLLGPTLMRLGLTWRSVEVVRSSLTCIVLLIYMLITGASPSVVRAVLMAFLFMAASILQRTAHPMNTLGAAALVILSVTPSYLLEPGFQLSFGAVAGIVSLTPRVQSTGPLRHGRNDRRHGRDTSDHHLPFREGIAGRYLAESAGNSP